MTTLYIVPTAAAPNPQALAVLRALRPTNRDPQLEHTCDALILIDSAREAYEQWQTLHDQLVAAYGKGRNTSGIGYASLSTMPSADVDMLRALACRRRYRIAIAWEAWFSAGRRGATFRRLLDGVDH